MAGEWLVRLANFENLNIVLLFNFIFVSENHITIVAVIIIIGGFINTALGTSTEIIVGNI